MASRQGSVRGDRFNENDVDFSLFGRHERLSVGGVSETANEDFSVDSGLGFGVRTQLGGYTDYVGRGEAPRSKTPRSEARRGHGRAASRGGRNVAAEDFAFSAGGSKGRVGRFEGARGGRGRGGRSVAGGGAPTHDISSAPECIEATGLRSGICSSPAVGSPISSGRGRGHPRSTATSDQEDSWSDRSTRGGKTRGRGSTVQGKGLQDCSDFEEGQQQDKGVKGRNFTPEEERQLTRSVLGISQDPITGSGQRGAAYWERIFQHYNEHRPFHCRPARSLESKWGLIKHDVAKFIGVLQQCTNLNTSSANASDILKHALELYRLKSAKNIEFQYLHVWEIVKHVPRWQLGNSQEKTNAPIMKRKQVVNDSDSPFLPSSSTDGGHEVCNSSRPRPQGSKSAKEVRRLTAVRESASLAQAEATKAMAAATLKKSQIMEDSNLFLLMTHSTDGSISNCAAHYLKLHQEEELDKLESRLMETRARRAGQQQPPPPIPVESASALQQRVAEALRPSKRRKGVRASSSQLDDLGVQQLNALVVRLSDSTEEVYGGDDFQRWEQHRQSCIDPDIDGGYGGCVSAEDVENVDLGVFFPHDGENFTQDVPSDDVLQSDSPVGIASWHAAEKDDADEECNEDNEFCIPESVFEDSQDLLHDIQSTQSAGV